MRPPWLPVVSAMSTTIDGIDGTDSVATRPYWVSWYSAGDFTYEGPWWISCNELSLHPDGSEESRRILCAAVMAKSEDDAKRIIANAHDDKTLEIEWRFVEERAADWLPLSSRFERQDWMKWPWPEPVASTIDALDAAIDAPPSTQRAEVPPAGIDATVGVDVSAKRYAIYLCDQCVAGEGGECHSPGCALFGKTAPGVPLRPEPHYIIEPFDCGWLGVQDLCELGKSVMARANAEEKAADPPRGAEVFGRIIRELDRLEEQHLVDLDRIDALHERVATLEKAIRGVQAVASVLSGGAAMVASHVAQAQDAANGLTTIAASFATCAKDYANGSNNG